MAITYPRPVGPTDRYDAYRISTTTAERENIPYPVGDGTEPQGASADIVLCHRVKAADPAFDPATQKLVTDAPAYNTADGIVTRGRSVAAKTQEEIDAYAEKATHNTTGTNKDNWIAVFKAGTGTNAQVQTALAWCLREITGPP